MSKLKHYKGENWEVKVKYIYDKNDNILGIKWIDRTGEIPEQDIPYTTGDTVIRRMNVSKSGVCGEWVDDVYIELINYLDNLTAPKIINEKTFDNPNFKIRIWETEDKIGAETIWIKDGFEWNANINDLEFARDISIDKEERTDLFVENIYPYFGMSGTKSDIQKSEINYTFNDLCKALERAEQETTELTYDTVVKELEGLKGEELYEAMKGYEYKYVYAKSENAWCSLSSCIQFFDVPEAFNRGLIKLRRVK